MPIQIFLNDFLKYLKMVDKNHLVVHIKKLHQHMSFPWRLFSGMGLRNLYFLIRILG